MSRSSFPRRLPGFRSLTDAALVSACLAFLAGCAYQPARLVRYEAETPEDVWADGQRLHPARTDSLAFLTGFVDYALRSSQAGPLFGSPMTFLVLVQNTSRRALTLDPADFHLGSPTPGYQCRALDPEEEIRSAARDMIETDGRYRHGEMVDGAVHLPLDLLNLFVTPFANQTPEEKAADARYQEERREAREEAAQDHERNMGVAISRRDRWAQEALRKTTLLPGMRAQGLVSFRQDSSGWYPDTVTLHYGQGADGGALLARYFLLPEPVPVPPRQDSVPQRRSVRGGSYSYPYYP